MDATARRPNLGGDTSWWRGTVPGKRMQGGAGLVELDVEAVNQVDVRSAFGTAVVALPTREHGAVPLPLPADEEDQAT